MECVDCSSSVTPFTVVIQELLDFFTLHWRSYKIQPSINTTKFSLAVFGRISCSSRYSKLFFFLPQTHCEKHFLHCNSVYKYKEHTCTHTKIKTKLSRNNAYRTIRNTLYYFYSILFYFNISLKF